MVKEGCEEARQLEASGDVGSPRIEELKGFVLEKITEGTVLADKVGVEIVIQRVDAPSAMHVHDHSDAVLLVMAGKGRVEIGDVGYDVEEGDRLQILKGTKHQVIAVGGDLKFLSIQLPPILNTVSGDLDYREV